MVICSGVFWLSTLSISVSSLSWVVFSVWDNLRLAMDFYANATKTHDFFLFISFSSLPTIFRYWWVLFIAGAWIDSLGVEWYILLQDVSTLLWFNLTFMMT